jgi:GT2 family glycosyltransferase
MSGCYMKISVVTPAHQRSPRLLRCLASVADQRGVDVEHIVQEKRAALMAGPDEPAAPAPAAGPAYRRSWFTESDSGLYDALNRGFSRATGEMLGWLNDDEQYLPGALERVVRTAAEHPEADIFFGGAVVVDEACRPLAWHRTARLRFSYVAAAHLYTLSCALFFRRRLWDRLGGFDAGLRIVGDEAFIGRALQAGARAQPVPGFLGAYSLHPEQLSAGVPAARREHAELKKRWPGWTRRLAFALKACRRLEDAAHGWWPGRGVLLDCALYQGDDTTQRSARQARCTGRWPGPVWM